MILKWIALDTASGIPAALEEQVLEVEVSTTR